MVRVVISSKKQKEEGKDLPSPSLNKKKITKEEEEGKEEKILVPNTYLEFFGRITKINSRKGNVNNFQVVTPKTEYVFNCRAQFFLPIMEGDAIFARGFVDKTGDFVELSQPPFASPGNDEDAIKQSCITALNGSSKDANAILNEVRKLLKPDEDLSSRLDDLALAHSKNKPLDKIVKESLQKKLEELLKWWYKKRCLRRLYLLGLTNSEIKRSGYHPGDLFAICLTNPYRVSSLSLEKCDDILQRFNKKPGSGDRECGEIMRFIQSRLDKKQTYLDKQCLINFYPSYEEYKSRLAKEYNVYVDDNYAALERIVRYEASVASFILSLLAEKKLTLSQEDETYLNEEVYREFSCDDDQKRAIHACLTNPISIVTGSAGTGKTTIIRALVKYLKYKKQTYQLTSFTGKAVARIKEIVGGENPLTLHRLLYMNIIEKFSYLIIDEVSMVETKLFYDFIEKHKHSYRLILIGDINQLPPIGWGCFFDQLIRSQRLPTYTLTTCHRSESADILTNAKLLLRGYYFEKSSNFQVYPRNKTPLDIIKENNLDMRHVRVIVPFNETAQEQNNIIQKYFARGLLPHVDAKGREWYLRDQVMMLKNNYTINVMNGQEGFITRFDEEGFYVSFAGKENFFTFRSDDLEKIAEYYPPSRSNNYLQLETCSEIPAEHGKRKKYYDEKLRICSSVMTLFHNFKRYLSRNNEDDDEDDSEIPSVDHLIHSYSLTVHKSQGSEWDHVIVYLPSRRTISSFVTRNLLYTAITRAKKCVYCLGNETSWVGGISNLDKEPRQLLSLFLSLDE